MSPLTVSLLAFGLAAGSFYVGGLLATYHQKKAVQRMADTTAQIEKTRLLLCKQDFESVYQVLDRSNGGIGKRLAECREITEAIFTNSPALFEQEPGLIHWLQATDRFLVELESKMPEDPTRAHIVNSRSAEIYERVHRAIGTEAAKV